LKYGSWPPIIAISIWPYTTNNGNISAERFHLKARHGAYIEPYIKINPDMVGIIGGAAIEQTAGNY